MLTFRHMCGFALKSKTSTEPLKTFGELAKRLLNKYLLGQVLADLEVSGETIRGQGTKSVLGSLQQICEKLARDIELPYFLWNAETRKELVQVLHDQISLVLGNSGTEVSYSKALSEFEYTAYHSELVVDGVFVKMINKDPYMRIEDPFGFICAAIQELDRSLAAKDLEQNPTEQTKVTSLLDAVNNLVVYQKGCELGILPQSAVKTLCRFVQFSEVPKSLEHICSYAFAVLAEASRESKQVPVLMGCDDFARAMLLPLCRMNSDFLVKRVFACLEEVANSRDSDSALISRGLVIVLLRVLFDPDCANPYRLASFRILQKVLTRQRFETGYLACFIPQSMLEQITDSKKEEEEGAAEIMKDHADVYLTWNAELRAKTKEILMLETKKVENWVASSGPLWIEIPKEPVIERYVNCGEVVVADIVLSRYIASPVVKLKKPVTKLLEELNTEIARCFLMFNQHVNSTEADIRETIGALGPAAAKVNLGLNAMNLEKGLLTMVTALMITYEQIFRNQFSPNRPAQEPHAGKKGISKMVATDKLRAIMYQGLRPTSCREMNITLLQMLCLVCEQKDVLGKDELQVLAVAVTQRLLDGAKTSDKLRKVEELAAVCALHKILDRVGSIKGRNPVVDIIVTKEVLEKLKELHSTRKQLAGYVEALIHRVAQSQHYQKMLAEELKFELAPDCRMEKIVNCKYEPADKFWRKAPGSPEECKIYEKTGLMEDFDPAGTGEQAMPLVSKKVFDRFDFVEASRTMIEAYGNEMKEFQSRISAPTATAKQHPFPKPKSGDI